MNTNFLVDEAQAPLLAWQGECHKRGLSVVLTCIDRSLLVQVALFAQGRQSYKEICVLRKAAGLWPISEKEASRKVTWRLTSSHIPEFCNRGGKVYGVDFALERCVGGVNKIHWDVKVSVNGNDEPDYIEAGKLAEEFGFKSGRHFKDYCHIEWPRG